MRGSTSSTPTGSRSPPAPDGAASAVADSAADVETVAATQPVAAQAARAGARLRLVRFRLPQTFDPLWIAGSALCLLLWWGATELAPSTAFPSPQSVALRIAQDFFSAPELSFYGLPDASLF